jgi:hypothetical protein
MNIKHVASTTANANSVEINRGIANNGNGGDSGNETDDTEYHNLSRPLPSRPNSDTDRDVAPGEELVEDTTNNGSIARRKKWNNTSQARHWCITFNGYTSKDEANFEQALKTGHSEGEVITGIVAKEIGENGNHHLQCYIHFKKLKRQSAVHAFFGYDTPCMHLSVQGKEGPSSGKPPLAAFHYCMKEDNYYVVGKNLDEIERLKTKTKIGTGRCSESYCEISRAIEEGKVTNMKQVRQMDAEVAAKSEEYFRGLIVTHMPKPPIKEHPLRCWQEMLIKKLEEPFNDREVVFVVDKIGNCGKSWFTAMYTERYGNCYTVGADKRDDISYQLINQIIDSGPPNVIFMDAPRARNAYVSSSWLEEIKNAKIVSSKYKSKTLHLPHRPHMVVMMNEFPVKNSNEKGLSDDRYTYLLIKEDGLNADWLLGYRYDEGGAMAPGFNPF